MSIKTIPPAVQAKPLFAPKIRVEEYGPVTPTMRFATPFFVCDLMTVKPKKVHGIKFSLRPLELRGIVDVEVTSQLPSFAGGITNTSQLADTTVVRNVSDSFSGTGATLQFPWRVTGLSIIMALWTILRRGSVTAKCQGKLSELIFSKDYKVHATIPAR